MKIVKIALFLLVVILLAPQITTAAGPFGPPQPAVKTAGGYHTGIGYWVQEDRYENGAEQGARQNQVYSELGYGSPEGWEITARVGMSDLRMTEAFRSSTAATTTDKQDFAEGGKFFSTWGAKGFYPFNKTFGIGAFVQGTYYFSDFTDAVSGRQNGAPFSAELRMKSLWEANAGIGFQVTVPQAIKIYLGPHFHYSEFKASPSLDVAGLALASGEKILRNRSLFGGFAGIEVPLAKGFRLNLEGQYTERLSAGAAVLYVY
ncbi:MAG: hypothetical protein M0009_17785 [Deltaproteobacteria bacterium]|nr:hypothetical protein [Deltaproteobacteria bacterium]